jgi:hypothetical protein
MGVSVVAQNAWEALRAVREMAASLSPHATMPPPPTHVTVASAAVSRIEAAVSRAAVAAPAVAPSSVVLSTPPPPRQLPESSPLFPSRTVVESSPPPSAVRSSAASVTGSVSSTPTRVEEPLRPAAVLERPALPESFFARAKLLDGVSSSGGRTAPDRAFTVAAKQSPQRKAAAAAPAAAVRQRLRLGTASK